MPEFGTVGRKNYFAELILLTRRMKAVENGRSTEEEILSRLAGTSCRHCTDGTLERDTYRDNAAVVCPDCDTPQVQFW